MVSHFKGSLRAPLSPFLQTGGLSHRRRPAKGVGDAWVRGARSAVLALPSVIIPEELNYLLNPTHPDFKNNFSGKPERFEIDPGLLTGRQRPPPNPCKTRPALQR